MTIRTDTLNDGDAPRPAATKLRLVWLDIARGAALLPMASYHLMWDLADFGYLDAAFPSTGWPRIYARAIASTFLFLAGFSLYLAHGERIRWRSFCKRLGVVAAAALLVTLATYFAMPRGFIFFGILHQIAVASLFGLIFLRAPWPLTVLVAIAVILAPDYLRSESFDSPLLWWIGLSTRVKSSFDFVPVLPWLGPFLIGLAVAKLATSRDWLRQFAGPSASTSLWKRPLAFLGRHSLVFYLVHQPVLIFLLYIFSIVVPAPQMSPEAEYIGSCETSCSRERDQAFCRRFCGCTLERLQQSGLLTPYQSGATSIEDDGKIEELASQCSALSQ